MTDIGRWGASAPELATVDGQLRKSQAEGKWGFTIAYDQVTSGVSLLTAQVEVWASRAWTINLNGFRYSSGNLSPVGPPPDNQTSRLVRARIQFGADSAAEDILVDYPARGCVIPVHGALVRVYIDPPAENINTGTTPTPILSGYLSPSNTSRAAVDSLGPTFTTRSAAINPLATQTIAIPRRACAYRLMYATSSINGVPFNVTQAAAPAGTTDQSWDIGSPGGAAVGELLASDGASPSIGIWRAMAPIPILPSSGCLRITNASTDTASTYQVQFLLDIG